MKKVLITAGGTTEAIDDVRNLTNISTGRLATKIAEKFLSENVFERHMPHEINYEVHYVMTVNAVMPLSLYGFYHEDFRPYPVTDVASVMAIMEELVPKMDIVIHAMAVSDFGFKPLHSKLKSNDPEAFIESMRERIIVNPKVISHIKTWNPNVFLVGFKFEVGEDFNSLKRIAMESMEKNKCDLMVANDLIQMNNAKDHVAHIIDKDGVAITGWNKLQIAIKLWETINTKMDLS